MRAVWWSAGALADLGRAALKQASKPTSGVAGTWKPSSSSQVATEGSDDANRAPQGARESTCVDDSGTSGTNPPGTAPLMGIIPELSTAIVPADLNPLFPTSMEQPEMPLSAGFETHVSPNWLNFDAAFENFDAVLGSSGADLSMELLKPFNFEDFASFDFPG